MGQFAQDLTTRLSAFSGPIIHDHTPANQRNKHVTLHRNVQSMVLAELAKYPPSKNLACEALVLLHALHDRYCKPHTGEPKSLGRVAKRLGQRRIIMDEFVKLRDEFELMQDLKRALADVFNEKQITVKREPVVSPRAVSPAPDEKPSAPLPENPLQKAEEEPSAIAPPRTPAATPVVVEGPIITPPSGVSDGEPGVPGKTLDFRPPRKKRTKSGAEPASNGHHAGTFLRSLLPDDLLRQLQVIDEAGNRLCAHQDPVIKKLQDKLWNIAREGHVMGRKGIEETVAALSSALGVSEQSQQSGLGV